MTEPYLAAVVQLTSTSQAERNQDEAERLIRRAARHGARLCAVVVDIDAGTGTARSIQRLSLDGDGRPEA